MPTELVSEKSNGSRVLFIKYFMQRGCCGEGGGGVGKVDIFHEARYFKSFQAKCTRECSTTYFFKKRAMKSMRL